MRKTIICIFIFIFIIIDFIRIHDVNHCSLSPNNIIKHNEICSYNNYVYSNMINILEFKKLNNHKILEIGAGEGCSTNYFINTLNLNNINYNYHISEIDDIYFNKLENIQNTKLIRSSWEKINEKYDIIISTTFSSINRNNYLKFKSLCNKHTFIITILSAFKLYKINEFNFNIIYKKKISLFFYIFILKI